ncbi:ras-related protein Rab-44-like isoform X3 [Thrips palmi]|uniref:Ras-related protein Rab-44-like isoform X3 n=1 Tax=Thrips palmi TaxID=161013 RepID=A0A6P9A961_THRPL|nr:ras-related protein Rab-44-like isoform X3 [Thrips palmi]
MNVLVGGAAALDANAILASAAADEHLMDPQHQQSAASAASAGEDDAGGGPPRRRSVGALLKLKSKKKESPQLRDSDSTAASETSLDVVPKKKTGFLRKSSSSSKKVKEADSPDGAAVKKPSKAKSLVRKLSMSRNRKSKEPPPTDPDTSDDDGHTSNASSTTAFESAVEGYATPAATPPPPPLTPPPMEEDEDQSDGGPGGAGGGGPGPRAASVAEPPVSTVTLPALEAVPTLDADMKGEKQPQRAGAHGGAVKKTPKGKASSSQGLVDEERKQSTRGQLLSITTPALQKQQKQLNGQAAAGTAPSAAPPATPTGSTPPTTSGASALSAPADVVHVVAEVGGLTPNGSGASGALDSTQDKPTNGAATATMKSSPPPTPPSPSSGDLMADARNKLSQSLGVHDSAQMSGEKREHLYKILVIGELGTGKTSIIKRYVHQFFSQHYRATIGVDFALKVLNWDPATIIRLQLWDIAGQERFGNMTRVYYKEAVGAFIVFDVTRASTFDAVVKWKQDLDSKVQMADGSPIPCVLLANKCDQQKEGMVNNPSKMDEYCKEKGFTGWFETSAKENVNIEEAARALVSKILLNDKLLHGNDTKDPTKIALDNNGKAGGEATSGKSCAC